MRELLANLAGALDAGRDCVHCCVVETRGSTPQKAGAAMLVFPDGSQRGTLGGGCVEPGNPVAISQQPRADSGNYFFAALTASPFEAPEACSRRVAALSVASQVKSGSWRPKCP